MSKLPYMQFYPDHWMMDTRPLSLAARGAWIDIITILWTSPTRGEKTMPVRRWGAAVGATETEMKHIVEELDELQIADIVTHGNGNVTIICRRMKREERERTKTRERVRKHRSKKAGGQSRGSQNDSNGNVTSGNEGVKSTSHGNVTPYITEDRVQKTDIEDSLRSSSLPGGDESPPAGGEADSDENDDKQEPPPEDDPEDPVIARFPVKTTRKEWPLHQSKAEEWAEVYSVEFVRQQLPMARQWCIDNPAQRKTPKGMTKFLSNWLNRNWTRGGWRNQPPPPRRNPSGYDPQGYTPPPIPGNWREKLKRLFATDKQLQDHPLFRLDEMLKHDYPMIDPVIRRMIENMDEGE